jgi:hypothetical protein
METLGRVDNWATAPVLPTCRGLSAASMDPADKPRGVGSLSQNVSSLMNCQHALGFKIIITMIGCKISIHGWDNKERKTSTN